MARKGYRAEHMGGTERGGEVSRRDVLIGLGVGVVSLTGVGFVFMKRRQSAAEQQQREDERQAREEAKKPAIEEADKIAMTLGQKHVAEDIKVAMDQEIAYEDNGKKLIGRNPIVLSNGNYGVIKYDLGSGQAFVDLVTGDLRPVAPKEGQPQPNPRTEIVDISPVFYPSTDPSEQPYGRHYLTVVGNQPGPINPTAPAIHVAERLAA